LKIAIIAPSLYEVNTYYSNNSRFKKFFKKNKNIPGYFHPNLALLTIAALTPDETEITLIDERVNAVNFDEDFDIVGITMMTAQALRGYEIADRFRERGVHVVIGGIHATTVSEEAQIHCDTLIAGEAENTWPRFLKDFGKGLSKKIYQDHSVDLTKSPLPRYDLVDTSLFHLLPIQTTRGCPFDCNFCTVTKVFGPKFRVKSVAQVVREVEAVQRVSRTRRCVFNDDNTFAHRKRAYEILEAIKPFRVKYFAQTDISIADDEKLLRLLQDSGCKTVFVGFESLVSENLAELQRSGLKLKRLDKYSESCEKIQAHGIQIVGSFIVGFDHDTRESLLLTRDFVLENNIWAQFPFLTPFPGTRVREDLIEQGRISPDDTDWDIYTCFDAVIEPRRMKIKDLEDTVLEMYESVYTDAAHRKRMRHMIDQMKRTTGEQNLID